MHDEQVVGEPTDKRGAVKWHNRRAIVTAAGELASAHGIQGFSVNDLAKEAGVSRRTIFNHFSSAEDAVYEHFSHVVAQLIDTMVADLPAPDPHARPSLGDVYREMCASMRSRDFVMALRPILSQVTTLKDSPAAALWSFQVTNVATITVRNVLQDRLPGHSAFELHLVATTLINSIAVCMDEWLRLTHGVMDTQSRAVWDRILAQGLDVMGRGFDT